MALRVALEERFGVGSMANDDTENAPSRRARRPLAAGAAIVVSGAAVLGYSAYILPTAVHVARTCVPTRASTACLDHSFWGFDPRLFLLATIVGLLAGAVLVILAILLFAWPRHHEMIGVFVLSASVISVVAYGGAFVGISAGVAGGILAILYRPPRSRELARWAAPRATRRPDAAPSDGSDPAVTPPPPLSADAYAPLPPVWRPFSVVAPTQPAPDASSLPRFGSIAEALAGSRAPAPPTPPSRDPPPAGPPSRLVDALAVSSRPPAPTGRVAPPPTPPRAAPPQGSRAGGTGARPAGDSPAAAPAPPPAGPEEPSARRPKAWKCPRCGLTNAPWSKSCTRCHAEAPALPD